MSNPEQAIAFYASLNYGHVILVDPPIHDEQENVYISNLRSDYPLYIRNEKPPQTRTLHIFEIDRLGQITSDQDGKIIKNRTTTRDECIKNIQSFFELWKKRTEEIVVYATSDGLVQLLKWNPFLAPIKEIVSELWEYEGISEFEINYCRNKNRRHKTQLYLSLLEGLKIVRKQEDGYIEGNTTVIARKEAEGDKNYFSDLLVSTILKERYSTLRDIFGVRILGPIIRIENCIYMPEIETDNQVYRSIDSISKEFKQNYNRPINKDVLRRDLEALVEYNLIEQDGKHFHGKDDLRHRMIEKQKEIDSVNSALLARA
ncbi:MAG: hypothetical protein NWE92_02010 [Candidatus Bathyarchaeota archaeon]|nr:hypothetical protein [Candidatus Bathyarchaeota archaeon]